MTQMIERLGLDRSTYPFESKFLETDSGRIHYINEGEGEKTLVFIHGTPTWSYLYRHLISGLKKKYRCVAFDHLGFGFSDKPPKADYRPQAHAERMRHVVNQLCKTPVTLVVHDFGGPIGLNYAIENPKKIDKLILFNTWMWSLEGIDAFEKGSRFLGGGLGKLLYKYLNFGPRVMIPLAFGDRSKLTRSVRQHYIKVLANPSDRIASWAFAKELIGSSRWYDQLWEKRDRIKDIPTLLLWGLKDPAFSIKEFERFTQECFTDCVSYRFNGVGHFPQEEKGAELCSVMDLFLTSHQKKTTLIAADSSAR